METNEKWLPIHKTNGSYLVSNLGRIKSLPRITMRKSGRILTTKERIIRQASDKRGYKRCYLMGVGTVIAHREVAKSFIPNPLKLPEVNHIDGDKANNNVKNLEWVTRKQNMEHASKNKLLHRNSRISDDEVRKIRKRYQPYSRIDGCNSMAKEYGIDCGYMYRIIMGDKRIVV